MPKMKIKVGFKGIVLTTLPIFILIMIFGILYFIRPKSVLNINIEKSDLISDMLIMLEKQTQIDNILLGELNSGNYSFEEPLVVMNPYDMSPLSALVLFTSGEPLNISIHVPGKTKLADADFTFDGYYTRHMIPVYGLYPNTLNDVRLIAKTQSGDLKNIILKIQTEPLPIELAKNIIITDLVQPENYQPGFNYTSSYKSAFDANGDYRWFYNDFLTMQVVDYNYNGNMIYAKGEYLEGDVLLFEINALGKIMNVYYSPYGVHHDISSIDGKNLIISGSYGDTIEDFIYEIDIMSGEIINTFDLKTILQRTRADGCYIEEPGLTGYNTKDWFHHNSTDYNEGNIIISGRHQSAVVKLSWPEGELKWILSEHTGWNPMFEKYLLKPIGEDFEWQYTQHSARILYNFDNNPDVVDILLFDNGYSRYKNDKELKRAIDNNEIYAPENFSRIVHYKINEKEMTVEQIWQFGKELGDKYYSTAFGYVQLLDNDNRMGTFDRTSLDTLLGINANFIEVDSHGNIVWEAYATSTDSDGLFVSYRLERLPLYTYQANNLQIGTSARNLIPEDKLP